MMDEQVNKGGGRKAIEKNEGGSIDSFKMCETKM